MQPIPFVDIRGSGPVELLRQHPDRARRLIEASREAFGLAGELASHVALPVGDRLAKAWLHKTANPYAQEIDDFVRLVPVTGLYALNLSYEWGCTSGVYEKDGKPVLTRVLDWPFPELGQHMVVAHQSGAAGEFHNVTWPGMSGIYNATAKGRFAAAINQAPMRRHATGIYLDWLRNRLRVWHSRALPPSHLLRKAFETAKTYAEARDMLANEPLALPVIYILSGTEPGEGCVIERLEDDCAVRDFHDGPVCAANHFESWFGGMGYGWMPRALDSTGRSREARGIAPERIDEDFRWYRAPIANSLSRVVMTACAADGTLRAFGAEGEQRVTEVFSL